jgi:Undecaprenyl-phosphate glucose phosphotransferase
MGRRLRSDFAAMATDALILWDILSITAGGYLCALLYGQLIAKSTISATFTTDTLSLSLLGGLLAPFVLRGARQDRPTRNVRDGAMTAVTRNTLLSVVLLLGLLLAVMFLTRIGDRIPRLWVLMWAAAIMTVTVGGRLVLTLKIGALEARGVVRERVAVVGSGPAAARLASRLKRERGASIELVGVFDEHLDAARDGFGNDCEHLVELGKRHELDWVILAMSAPAPDRLNRIVHELKALDVQVAVCPLELSVPNAEICLFGSMAMMLLVNRPIGRWGLLAKEATDKVLSALAIVALAPLMAVIAVAIWCDDPGPIIFRQKRHGRNNTEFEVLKFRTMRVAPPEATDGRVQTRRDDSRVTRPGAFLRHTSLDELPQLFNVLRGDMSLVGPRPHPCEMRTKDRLSAEISAEYPHRHRVKPGITGWAQINGERGPTETEDQVRRRIECDLYYIENWSFMLDLKILLLTPLIVAFNRDRAF